MGKGKLKIFDGKDVAKGGISILLNIVKNNFLDGMESKAKTKDEKAKVKKTKAVINLGIMFLGKKTLRAQKSLSDEYIRYSALEAVARDYAEDSKIDFLKKQAPHIQGSIEEDEDDYIQALINADTDDDSDEDYINADDADDEDYINADDDDEIEGLVNVGDNIDIETEEEGY